MNGELNHKQDTFVPAGTDNRAYTVDDLRNILKVSKTSVYRLLRSKCFHYVRIGGQYRISKRALITGLMVRKEELKMAFVNMFNERVELFNLKEENERLAELFSDEKLQGNSVGSLLRKGNIQAAFRYRRRSLEAYELRYIQNIPCRK